MRERSRHRPVWTIVFLAGGWLVIAMASLGVFHRATTAGDKLGFLRIQTPSIAGDARISERFSVYEPSLIAIEIHPVLVGPAHGAVLLELREGENPAVIRSRKVRAADLVSSDTFRFTFAPIADSRGKRYRLDVSSSAEDPAAGVALWATRGERLEDAGIYFNDVSRFADLWFQTFVLPIPVRPRALVWIACVTMAMAWGICAFLLRELAA